MQKLIAINKSRSRIHKFTHKDYTPLRLANLKNYMNLRTTEIEGQTVELQVSDEQIIEISNQVLKPDKDAVFKHTEETANLVIKYAKTAKNCSISGFYLLVLVDIAAIVDLNTGEFPFYAQRFCPAEFKVPASDSEKKTQRDKISNGLKRFNKAGPQSSLPEPFRLV